MHHLVSDAGDGGMIAGPAWELQQRPLLCPFAGAFAPRTDARAVWHMLTSSFLNTLLICMPIGIWAGATGASPTLVFSAVGGAYVPVEACCCQAPLRAAAS